MEFPNDQIAAAFKKSGKTQESFCTEQGITIHRLRYYLYKKGTRRHSPAPKLCKAAFSTVPPPSPAGFISFNQHPGADCTTRRQQVTIITGHFSIAEIVELVAKTGTTVC